MLLGALASTLASELEGGSLGVGLNGIQGESRLLDVLAGAGSEVNVSVQGGVPASEETALDLGVLGESGLSDTLHGEGVLLEGSGQGILASTGVVLVQDLATGQTSTGNGMAEGLGLRLSGRGGYQGCLGFGGRCGTGEQLDLLADGAAEVLEGLLDVGRVIVGLVGVVGAAGKFWSAVGSSR